MKTLFILALTTVLLLPPALPASFYGSTPGTIDVYVNWTLVKTVRPFYYQGELVYTVNLSMDGIEDGTMAWFKVGDQLCGSARLYSGNNTHLDIVCGGRYAGRVASPGS